MESISRSHHDKIGLLRYEDTLQPFVLHRSSIRGRMVRLCPALDTILKRHDNPACVNHLLAEILTLAAMLSANLPEGGILTMQAKGDGPVKFIVVDAVHGGELRGYADIADGGLKRLADLEEAYGEEVSLGELMGTGYLCMTLDMGYGEPSQGIVPLEGGTITEAIENYFTMSQQIDVLFNTMVGKRTNGDGTTRWSAGGIMLERIPDEGGHNVLEPVPDDMSLRGWDYNELLVLTATQDELLDPHLKPSALLYRLFNEVGVWVNDAQDLSAGCRCSRERITGILRSMKTEDIEHMKENGIISVTCQFCNQAEVFTDEDIAVAR
jgi:molecular chaperone Hsp33